MARIFSFLHIILALSFFTPLTAKRGAFKYKERPQRHIEKVLTGENVVIFIHGTIIPLISPLNYRALHQKGLIPFAHCSRRDQLIADTLKRRQINSLPRPQKHLLNVLLVYTF